MKKRNERVCHNFLNTIFVKMTFAFRRNQSNKDVLKSLRVVKSVKEEAFAPINSRINVVVLLLIFMGLSEMVVGLSKDSKYSGHSLHQKFFALLSF